MVKNDHLVFVDQVIGSQRLRTVSAVGETFPLYCTANGKAYLAELDDAAVERLIGTRLSAPHAEHADAARSFARDLKSVRKTGVAIDREEHTHGICAAGIVTRDPLGNSLAISVPVPAQRFYDASEDGSSSDCARPRRRWSGICWRPPRNAGAACPVYHNSVQVYRIAVQAATAARAQDETGRKRS